jgi:hypothetical protein
MESGRRSPQRSGSFTDAIARQLDDATLRSLFGGPFHSKLGEPALRIHRRFARDASMLSRHSMQILE